MIFPLFVILFLSFFMFYSSPCLWLVSYFLNFYRSKNFLYFKKYSLIAFTWFYPKKQMQDFASVKWNSFYYLLSISHNCSCIGFTCKRLKENLSHWMNKRDSMLTVGCDVIRERCITTCHTTCFVKAQPVKITTMSKPS